MKFFCTIVFAIIFQHLALRYESCRESEPDLESNHSQKDKFFEDSIVQSDIFFDN